MAESIIRAIVLLLIFFPSLILCQNNGFRYLKNYTPYEYSLHPQNWALLQDKRGALYVGNHGNLLEFDGVSWRIIEIPNWSARSLDIDESGVIYAGGNNEIGFLAPDSQGTLVYRSLLEHIPFPKRNFSNVWKTYCIKNVVYFHSSRSLFCWNTVTGKMKILEPPLLFNASFKCGEKYVVHQRDSGLMEMVNGSLQFVPNGKAMKGIRIYMMVEYLPGVFLVGTGEDGFFLYRYRTGVFTPFPTEADEYIKKNQLYDGVRLSHTPGAFALATTLGGLVIIDSNGKIKDIFTKSYGLLDNNVRYVMEDRLGNLWLGLNYGISRIEYAPSPISFYDTRSGLSGIILSVVRDSKIKDLYVGTSVGLFVREQMFLPIPGITGSCFSLLSVEDSILSATMEGLFRLNIQNRQVTRLNQVSSYTSIRSVKDPNRLWVGTRMGVQSFYLWRPEYSFESINMPVRSIVEDQQGSLWLGVPGKGAIRVDFADSAPSRNPVMTFYDETHGLPQREVNVFSMAGQVRFGTEKGLYRFDRKNNVFHPDPILAKSFADGSRNMFRLVEDSRGHPWFHSSNQNFHAVPMPDGSFKIDSRSFGRIPLVQVNDIYPDGEIIWFASNDSLIRYDSRIKTGETHDFPVLIRQLKAMDQDIFPPVFDYKDRNFRFTFAALFFCEEARTEYRYFLEGYDEGWSGWSFETQKDYTNLDSKSYRFRVMAKNLYGDLSREAVYRFEILPPWHKTWWAYSFAVLLAIFAVFLIVRWRSAKLVKEKERLEEIVKHRTRQLEIQATQLQEMDKIKSRFFANISHEFRTPLTLIMGPLEQVLDGNPDTKTSGNIDVALRNSRRLLTLINQLLDLSKLDSGKMRLRAERQNIIPILKSLVGSFESLARQKNVELSFHSDRDRIDLYFDSEKLERIIINLVGNAFKFTPEGGKIDITAALLPTGSKYFMEIRVSDTGVGIPGSQLPYIFDRFYQGGISDPGGNKQKGTGIGLALVKELIDLHYGEIDVQSIEGKGTEFIVRFQHGEGLFEPKENVKENTDTFKLPYNHIENELENELPGNKTEEGQEKIDPGKDLILVVEDNADVRRYIRAPLEAIYSVIEAIDGKEGIEKAREFVPDLIVSDIMMPGIDGYELCKTLKTDVATSHIPIVLLTAKASDENVIQGLETGADDYLTKPFNIKILLTRIKNLIDLRRVLQEKIQREMVLHPTEIAVSSIDQAFTGELKEAIEKNISDMEFGVDELANVLYLSRATLNRKIRALTGESTNQFIQSYRLKRAAQLLKANFGNVTEVAFEVGFSSSNYFTKCFREKFQRSPHTFQASEASSRKPEEI